MAGSPATEAIERVSFDPEEIRSVIDQVPKHRNYQLTPHHGTMQLTVMPDAWKGAGRTQDEPGDVDQYYFEEQDLLVVDLSRP